MKEAIRPSTCTAGTPIALLSNFFKFSMDGSSSEQLYIYSLQFEPHLPDDSPLRYKLIRKARSTLSPLIGNFVFANNVLMSPQIASEAQVLTVAYDDSEFTITATPVEGSKGLESGEFRSFFNKFFNSIQGRTKMVMIGRKFYNPEGAIALPQHKLTIWPGYCSSVCQFDNGIYVNIDISHRCLRTVTVLEQLQELKNKRVGDLRLAFSKLLVGCTVLTLYNRKCYHIDDVDWDLGPSSSFSGRDGTPVTYSEYYSTKWNRQITVPDQPLLLSKVRDLNCYLVPEFCILTGLTDELRADFNVMKDLALVTKKEPAKRLEECGKVIATFYNAQKIKDEIRQWRADIARTPITLQGRVLSVGEILMGRGKKFAVPANGAFDRDVQCRMFTQPPLSVWGVFYVRSDERLVETFLKMLKDVIATYQVECEPPKRFPVSTDRWDQWDEILRKTLNPQVNIAICILPGARGKSRLYDDLKRLTFSQLPVPTQVILNATLKKDKGLRSVLNKVIMQVNAKVGGIPWAMKDLPLQDLPTMVMGIDIYHKAHSYSVLGVCATVDQYFAKYISIPTVNAPSESVTAKLSQSIQIAITEFARDNKCKPQRIIVFRDGVSDSQRTALLSTEVAQIKEAFTESYGTDPLPSLTFIVVNKRINARFYASAGGRANNPPLGTCVDQVVCSAKSYDFYLTPARATQGAMTPTHFHVLYDDSMVSCEDLQQLAYRLCYAYYNWSGSIRVPAPCQYAHKLAYIYGERATSSGPPVPHGHWKSTRCLYFL